MYLVSARRNNIVVIEIILIISTTLSLSTFAFSFTQRTHTHTFNTKTALIPIRQRHLQKADRYRNERSIILKNKGALRCYSSLLVLKLSSSANPSSLFEFEEENNSDNEECWMIPPTNNIVECFLPTPRPEIEFNEVVNICLTSLQQNNEPYVNAGLEVCFNFSSDRTRAAFGGGGDKLVKFIEYAQNPTFGCMIGLKEWDVLSVGPEIAGTNIRGAMRTVLTNVLPMEGREKRFLWTLQKERRPPRAGCWLIHELLFVDMAFELTE